MLAFYYMRKLETVLFSCLVAVFILYKISKIGLLVRAPTSITSKSLPIGMK